MSTLPTSDALELIEKLQDFVIQRNETIKDMQKQIENLKTEKDNLTAEVAALKRQNSALKLICHTDDMTLSSIPTLQSYQEDHNYASSTTTKHLPTTASAPDDDTTTSPATTTTSITLTDNTQDRETASRGESTSYDIVNERRDSGHVEAKLLIKTPSKKHIHRTSSRDRTRAHRTDSANLYELSTDIADKAIECLEKKYGGKENANQAARAIQQCYRHWVLNKGFKRVRAYSGRKRSLTMPEKQFEKLKQKSLVFYGPDNPVMIVDGENEQRLRLAPIAQFEGIVGEDINSDSSVTTIDSSKQNIMEIVHEEGMKMCSQNVEDSDEGEDDDDASTDDNLDQTSEKNEGEKTQSDSTAPPEEKDIEEESAVVSTSEIEEKEEKDSIDGVTVKKQLSRSSSGSSSQYDIIDDTSVLTVVGRPSVGLQDGTTLEVDCMYDDSPDGISMSTAREEFEPSVDKPMHKRQFRIGVNLFNWKPEVGIQYLIDNGHMGNNVKSIAEFLRKETTVSKQKISEYFGNLRNEFNMQVLSEFGRSFDFVGKDVDEALRQFQSYFKLTGEAQTVEKFLQIFSDRYVECNPGRVSDNPDTILLLAFALAMLNTDLHNQNVKRRMTPEEFMKNLRGTDDGNDLDQLMLRNMYTRIQKNEFATGADHTTQLHQIENSFVGKVPNLAVSHRQFVKLFTVEEVHETNRKDSKAHNRLAFLFNDLLLLAKPRGKSGSHGAGHVFTCKASYSLLGKKVAEFSNEHYNNGVVLVGRFDNKVIASFNLKDEKTKKSFVEELDEYIRETNGMENIRLALSKVKQLSWHNRRKEDGRTKSLLIQDTDSNHKMESTDTSSLTDLRLGSISSESDTFTENDNKISTSSSMGDINEADSETDDYDGITRANSANCLEPRAPSSDHHSNKNQRLHPHAQQSNSVPRTTSVKQLFNHFAPKFRKSMTYGDRRGNTSPGDHHDSQKQRREKSPSPPIKRSPSLLDRSDKRTTMI